MKIALFVTTGKVSISIPSLPLNLNNDIQPNMMELEPYRL